MALAIAKVTGADYVAGNKKYKIRDVTFDATYPDNGESLTADDVGLSKITEAIPHGPFRKSDGSLALMVSYDHTNSKLLAYVGTSTAQDFFPEGTTADISTYSGRITFVGF